MATASPPLPAAAGVRRRPRVGLLSRAFVRSPLAIAALGVVTIWVALAVLAGRVAPYPPLEQDLVHRLAPPSPAHWFGTDPLGRDLLTRVLYGARLSLPIGVVAVMLAMLLGIAIGGTAGFIGGLADETTMRITDLMLAFPTVILAMVIIAALGAGIRNAVIAIMIAWWPSYARLVRGLVLALRDREFVLAARALGAGPARVFLRHVLPATISPIIILGTLDVGHAILTFASLSFLGLGPPPQVPEWGSMVASGRRYLDQWWVSALPGLAILNLVLAFNVLGDSLRDFLDPRFRKL